MHAINPRATWRLVGLAGVCAALLLVPRGVRSHTYLGFDWTLDGGNERTTLLYSVNPLNANDGLVPAQSWLGIANAMGGIWNAAGIGLTLRPTNQGLANEGAVTAATNIEIRLRDHNARGGAFLDGIFDPAMAGTMCDAASWPARTARVDRVLLCFDPTPLSNQGAHPVVSWRNDGADTLDPTAVAVHEVSHAMRMHHANLGAMPPAGAHRTNPIPPGDHGTMLTAHDIAEGRASAANRGIRVAMGNVNQAGGAVAVQFPVIDENALPVSGPLSLAFAAGVLGGDAAVTLRPLDGAALPFPVAGGASPVFMALHVDIAGAGVQPGEVVVTFSYADEQFTDGPHAIWVDARGDIYISEVVAHDKIQKYVRQ